MENIVIQMVTITSENSKMIKEMEKEGLHLPIKIIMKGNGFKTNIMDKEFMFGRIKILIMKDNGKIIKFMEKEK
jgi:hypothetical protein